jgi:hypothetical protein
MSTFHGKQGKGAMRAHRATKTREAVERQAKVRPERKRELRRLAESMAVSR